MNGKNNIIRKVKNFKVPIYYYEMQRKLKKNGIDLSNFFGKQDYEDEFKEFVSSIISYVELASIYSTYPITKAKKIIKSREFLPDEKVEYITISILTLGAKIDNIILSKEGNERIISDTIIEVYLSKARETIIEMINEEAVKDNYIISKPTFIYSTFEVENKIVYEGDLLELLKENSPEKILVNFSNSMINPYFTEIFFVNWTYKKTKK
jgi:hypothetical protein